MIRHIRTFILSGICLTAAAPAFADGVGYVTFENKTAGQLCIAILHSDGKVQKGNCVDAQGAHRFRFSSSDAKCKSKSRGFEVFLASGGTKLGASVLAGNFKFKGTLVPTANQSNKCALSLSSMEMTQQDEGYSSGWDNSDIGKRSTTIPVSESSN